MNQHDRLLAWASELGEGTWTQWREACAYLDLEPTATANNLSALGHLEFDWAGDRFACAPTAAALIPRSSGSVIVTGARPRDLRNRLHRLWESPEFNVWFHDPIPQPDGPETWLIEAEFGDLEAFCSAASMAFEVDPGARMLDWTPRATLDEAAEPGEPMEYYPRQWVDPVSRRALYDVPHTRDGLWFVKELRRKTAFLLRSGQWFRVPVREHGIYLAYPEQVFLIYEGSGQRLLVDDAAPLPPLLARGATLQSGRLPSRPRRGRHAYENISIELARIIGNRLAGRVEGIDDR